MVVELALPGAGAGPARRARTTACRSCARLGATVPTSAAGARRGSSAAWRRWRWAARGAALGDGAGREPLRRCRLRAGGARLPARRGRARARRAPQCWRCSPPSVAPGRRAAAATTVWVMMIFGFALTAPLAGRFLDPFSPDAADRRHRGRLRPRLRRRRARGLAASRTLVAARLASRGRRAAVPRGVRARSGANPRRGDSRSSSSSRCSPTARRNCWSNLLPDWCSA